MSDESLKDFDYCQEGNHRVAVGYSAIYFHAGRRIAFVCPSLDELKKAWHKFTPKGTADLDLTMVQKIELRKIHEKLD